MSGGSGPAQASGAEGAGRAARGIDLRVDDLSSPDVQALLAGHLAAMRGHSPPGLAHALAIEDLRHPDITVWTAWSQGVPCGCGALKRLDADSGEIKSMRTAEGFVRRGVGQRLLDGIVQAAVARGWQRLYLETGTGAPFAAAHRLYLRNGFQWCGPFGTYTASGFNLFMTRSLAAEPPAPD